MPNASDSEGLIPIETYTLITYITNNYITLLLLAAMLMLYLITPIRHKFLFALPYIVNAVFVLSDLFDTRFVYSFGENRYYSGGALNKLSQITLGFYIIMLGVYSIFFLAQKSYSKSIIVMFVVSSTIRSLCYTDSEKAADYIDVFGDYLWANIDSLSSEMPIEFTAELNHIRHYIALEKASIDFDFNLETKLKTVDFRVPPLTVQPLVENAVKHGAITRRDGSGIVTFQTAISNGRKE